jgi:hypothetical protein
MSTAIADQFIVELDDGQKAVIAETVEAERLLRGRLPEGDNLRTRIALSGDGDVEGHTASGNSVAVTLEIEGDTEGHALSLRFPTPQAARDFEKRMLATGVLVGTIAVGAVGIGLSQSAAQSAVGPAAQPAVVAPLAAPRDMDKELAPIAAPRDMDKELAPIAAPRDMDKDLSPQRAAPGSTQRLIRE